MTSWQEKLDGDTLPWLLEETDHAVCYLALRNLLALSKDDQNLVTAKQQAQQQGPIATILDAMSPQGFWAEPGPGYLPKYRSTVWSVILLAQLRASVNEDLRIAQACRYLMEHALTEYGQFSASGTPGGTCDCLQCNLCAAMLDLGYQDPRLDSAFEWMARSLTGDGVAPMGDKSTPIRYYAGQCRPGFACGSNNKLPCDW